MHRSALGGISAINAVNLEDVALDAVLQQVVQLRTLELLDVSQLTHRRQNFR